MRTKKYREPTPGELKQIQSAACLDQCRTFSTLIATARRTRSDSYSTCFVWLEHVIITAGTVLALGLATPAEQEEARTALAAAQRTLDTALAVLDAYDPRQSAPEVSPEARERLIGSLSPKAADVLSASATA